MSKMTIEQIYKHLRFDLWNQIEEGKDWFCIASSATIDKNGHGIVVWCDEDNDGKYFDVTIRENYSKDDWGDTLNSILEQCSSGDDFEELESIIVSMLQQFYNMEGDNVIC